MGMSTSQTGSSSSAGIPRTPCSGYVAFSWKPAARGDLAIVELDPRTEPAWIRNAYPGTWKRVDCTPSCGAHGKLSAAETARLLQRGLRGGTYVACHRVASFAWDYECSYREKGYFRRVGPHFGVDVDERGIVRTNRRSERQLGHDPGAALGGRHREEAPAENLNPVGQADKPRSARVSAAAPIVLDAQPDDAVLGRERDPDRAAPPRA